MAQVFGTHRALIAELRRTGASEPAAALLAAVADGADDSTLIDLHAALQAGKQFEDADYLLEAALLVRSVSFMEFLLARVGGLHALWHDRGNLRSALRQIGARRSSADIVAFMQLLRQRGYTAEARHLAKYAMLS